MVSIKLKKSRKYIAFLRIWLSIKVFFGKINYILLFFLALLVFSFSYSFFMKQNQLPIQNIKDIPKIEVKQLTLNRFNTDIVDMKVKADVALQYDDKDIFIGFFASRINDDSVLENLSGKEVWHVGDSYDFIEGIHYTKLPEIKFFSQKGVYNSRSGVFVGQGDFFIEDVGMTTTGKDIFYDSKADTITAKYIITKILRL